MHQATQTRKQSSSPERPPVFPIVQVGHRLRQQAVSIWSALVNKQPSRMFPMLAGLIAIAIGLTAVLAPATFIGVLILLVGIWNIYL
jgi:hypothetical protein